MAWKLNGQLIEACSCNMFCPCWFGVPELMIMDQGWCFGVITARIDEGEVDGVDLSGRTMVLSGHFPGPTMFDGGGTGRVFVDEGASDEQRERLEEVVQGKRGGPWEAIAPVLFANWLPTQSASIDLSEDGDRITIGVDGTGTVESTLVRDQEGQEFTLTGGGFVTGFGLQEAQLAPAPGEWRDSEMPVQPETKSGARGAFTWAG